MALSVRLDLKQSQSLVMTPQLQQAIKLLQMSNVELTAFVEDELERNPLLQRDDSEDAPFQETDTPDSASTDQNSKDSAALADINLNTQDTSSSDSIDAEVDNQWSSDTPGDQTLAGSGGLDTTSHSTGGAGGDTEGFDWEQNISTTPSLRDHLIEQINLDIDTPGERLIAVQMLEHLDGSGYFLGDLNELSETMNCEMERLETVLSQLQKLDPVGIFARNLSECLALQLREKDRFDPAMQTLVENLDMLSKREYTGLLKLCRVDEEDLHDMIQEIQALDPRPALAFDTSEIQAITPDILMKPGLKGKWRVELNSDNLPKVLVDNTYYAEISQVSLDKESKHYISECFQSANWLIKSLHQRATTILRVATEIVRQQDAFFKKGIEHLKPIVLRDIAEAVEMHESTVSRVTSNKYIATPRGIFELKYFFTSAINRSDGGDAHSAESVKYRIKRLIDEEDPRKILSDDKIVQLLKNDDIDIARRTVAKYREALGIASSVQRRREKKALLTK